jgi:hypothetical protein
MIISNSMVILKDTSYLILSSLLEHYSLKMFRIRIEQRLKIKRKEKELGSVYI